MRSLLFTPKLSEEAQRAGVPEGGILAAADRDRDEYVTKGFVIYRANFGLDGRVRAAAGAVGATQWTKSASYGGAATLRIRSALTGYTTNHNAAE
ncbi:MAG: hypothetical protein WBC78_11015 [Candidatus Sulfotelmatobacter sp.]